MAFQCRTILLSLMLFLLIPAVSRSQAVIFEGASGVEEFSPCDVLHNTQTCLETHFDNESAAVGMTVKLGGTAYVVEWIGKGYYLESGLVLELLGKTAAGLKNQQWFEVYPKQGRIHTSRSWQDTDHNRRLSVADSLTLEDGRTLRIRDVRLHLRARPVSPD